MEHIDQAQHDDELVGGIAPAEPIVPRERYFNRELSWLAFNQRVLEEASNRAHPLLERLRFLSISGNNLDEFFMVRFAGLRAQQLEEVESISPDGLTLHQQIEGASDRADQLITDQQRVWDQLRAELDAAGIVVLEESEIEGRDAEWLEGHFRNQIFPVLTPQAL
ncbi:MAG: RNA degradosome polyphosphate kinase, partial [Rhizorhabdus sp.]